jgi:hypothetical protein
VRVERLEAGPRGLVIEVMEAPGLWVPDVCEACMPVALGLLPPSDVLYCGHTPSLGGDSLAAQGVLLTVMAIADVHNWDAGRIVGDRYVVECAFELAICFAPNVGRAQRERLRSTELAFRDRGAVRAIETAMQST